MLSIPRFSTSSRLGRDLLGEALLNWGFLRTGLSRAGSAEELPDHVRRDIGLAPRGERPSNPRDWSW